MKNQLPFLTSLFLIFSIASKAQNPSSSIAVWKDDAAGAYTIIHDDYGDFGVDGIWQYGDTMAYNRGLRFTFGAIASACENQRNINGYSSPYTYARDVMMAQHGHEIINHSHDHTCAVGNAGWTPCNMNQGWGESEFTNGFDRELDDAHVSITNGVDYAPVYYIFPFDRFTNLANDRLKTLGYIGSRTGWTSPLNETFIRENYNGNDPNDILPDNDGFFRSGVQVFDDAHSDLPDAGQVAVLNSSVDAVINDGTWANRELHNVGPTGWGNVSINAYRTHLNYVQSRVESGQLYMAPVTEILSYLFQKAKFSPSTSFDAQNEIITVSWNQINPQIDVVPANYIDPLEYKTPITLLVDLDGLSGDWVVTQNGINITDFTVSGSEMQVNVYPHEGAVQIALAGNVPNQAPFIVSAIPDQNLLMGFENYTIDLKTIFDDDVTSVENLIYSVSGNSNIIIDIVNGVASISADNSYEGTETITFTAEDEGGLMESDVVSFIVEDQFANQQPYLGEPHQLPGTIEAEDYDIGPEGVAYNEEFNQFEPEPENNPYRANHPVDIENFDNNEYALSYTVANEWLEYTVEVQTGGNFTVNFTAAQLDLGGDEGSFRLLLDGVELVPTTSIEFTGGWYDFLEFEVAEEFFIPAGTHILRLEVVTGDANLDKMEFISTPTNTFDIADDNLIKVYPNPARDILVIDGQFDVASVFSSSGQLVDQTTEKKTDVNHLREGVYFIRFNNNNQVVKFIKSR